MVARAPYNDILPTTRAIVERKQYSFVSTSKTTHRICIDHDMCRLRDFRNPPFYIHLKSGKGPISTNPEINIREKQTECHFLPSQIRSLSQRFMQQISFKMVEVDFFGCWNCNSRPRQYEYLSVDVRFEQPLEQQRSSLKHGGSLLFLQILGLRLTVETIGVFFWTYTLRTFVFKVDIWF